MPSPSRWGPAAGYINVSAPKWVYEAIDSLRKEADWKTLGNAGLELIVEALAARGIRASDATGTSGYPAGGESLLKVAEPPPAGKRKGKLASGARGGRRE